MSQTKRDITPVRYEATDRLRTAHRSHLVSQAHLEAGASRQVCDAILFRGADPYVSAARRRVLAYALKAGLLRPINSEPSKADRVRALEEIDSLLAKGGPS